MTHIDQLTDEQREQAEELAGWKNRQLPAESEHNTIETDIRIQGYIDSIEFEFEAAGINPDEIVVWSEQRECWTVA